METETIENDSMTGTHFISRTHSLGENSVLKFILSSLERNLRTCTETSRGQSNKQFRQAWKRNLFEQIHTFGGSLISAG